MEINSLAGKVFFRAEFSCISKKKLSPDCHGKTGARRRGLAVKAGRALNNMLLVLKRRLLLKKIPAILNKFS